MTPKETHDLDQMFAAVVAMAVSVATYHNALVENRVPADLAAMLTVEYQQRILTLSLGHT